MEKWHKKVIKFPSLESTKPIPIIADGSIATVLFGDGRNIPVLIIDTSNRLDIVDLINAQVDQPPGDVKCNWGRYHKSKKYISLYLFFERPVATNLILEFDIVLQGILVEAILSTQALYLQQGCSGDKVSSTFQRNKILVEVADTGFKEEWRKLFLNELIGFYRKNGLGRKSSRGVAEKVISESKKLTNFRMGKSK